MYTTHPLDQVNVVDGGVEKVLSRISEYSKVEPTGLREAPIHSPWRASDLYAKKVCMSCRY